MTSLFPNSNLSTGSQPWGREVEKRLGIKEKKGKKTK
jgi:hypothetical protein